MFIHIPFGIVGHLLIFADKKQVLLCNRIGGSMEICLGSSLALYGGQLSS